MKELSVRQMQAYAAICLWLFCEHFSVKHTDISKLIRHLLSMLTAKSLPEWETQGACLEITGRGDPVPEYVLALIPKDKQKIFCELVDSCVEVGIVDMYGELTGQPKLFLNKARDILQKLDIHLPAIEGLDSFDKDDG